ncbi:MAG: hypothetical protein ACI4J6_12665 [Oscillospiraceae bacterium]
MADSIIAGIRAYINGCEALFGFKVGKRFIDWTDDSGDNYGIMPDGEKQLKRFITGGGKYQYNFTLYIKKLSEGDAQRLKNAELLEAVQRWCNGNNLAKAFPDMPKGCTPTKITAENAMLIEQGGNKNTYQIQFTLLYTKGGN